MDKKTLESKIKRSVQVLLYLFEVKTKIKTVAKVFEKIAGDPNFRLFGNVELGRDVSIQQLKENYDAVILATG